MEIIKSAGEFIRKLPENQLRPLLYALATVVLIQFAVILKLMEGQPYSNSVSQNGSGSEQAIDHSTIQHIDHQTIISDPHKNDPVVTGVTISGYTGLNVTVNNVPTGDAKILVNGKDINSTLNSEIPYGDGNEKDKMYQLEGVWQDLNLRIGNNIILLKYGIEALPAFEFKITEKQKIQYQRDYASKMRNENFLNHTR